MSSLMLYAFPPMLKKSAHVLFGLPSTSGGVSKDVSCQNFRINNIVQEGVRTLVLILGQEPFEFATLSF